MPRTRTLIFDPKGRSGCQIVLLSFAILQVRIEVEVAGQLWQEHPHIPEPEPEPEN